MAHSEPQRAITDLDELKNIIMLGLDVWLVCNDSELRHITEPSLKQKPNGLHLAGSGMTQFRVALLGFKDGTFAYDGNYAETGSRIFDNIEAARTQSYNVWMKLNAEKFGMKPR